MKINLFHMLQKDYNIGLDLIDLVNALSNSQESSTNASLLTFLVEFPPLLGQITQLLYNKQQLTQRIMACGNLRLHHLEEYDSAMHKALSLDIQVKETNEMAQSIALKVIEHHEVAVKLGQNVACSTQEKEFVEVKLEICESIYERLKANLQL